MLLRPGGERYPRGMVGWITRAGLADEEVDDRVNLPQRHAGWLAALRRRVGLARVHEVLVVVRLQTNRRAFQFEVLGLPHRQQAWIADFDGGWRVLRVINGEQGHWTQPYESKEEALNNLAEAIESTDQ